MQTTMIDRWGVPAAGLLIGAVFFAAAALGGQAAIGAGMFAVMAVYVVALLALGGRSETVGVLRGRPADERWAGFNLVATAAAGVGAIVVALAGFAWQLAHGEPGTPFALVAVAAGAVYLAALGWLRWRR
jgi:hypothetical protein